MADKYIHFRNALRISLHMIPYQNGSSNLRLPCIQSRYIIFIIYIAVLIAPSDVPRVLRHIEHTVPSKEGETYKPETNAREDVGDQKLRT